MKKYALVIIILVIISMLATLFSCGTGSSDGSDKSTSASATTVATASPSTADPKEFDDIGEFDFKGKEFRVINAPSTSWNTVFFVAEESGDLINDAVLMRNKAVEDRFNFVIKENRLNDQGAVKNTASAEILAGSDSFDMAILVDRDALSLAQLGQIYSFDELQYIDTTKNYWSQTINRDMSINNKLYFSFGDFNLTGYDYTVIMLYNKNILKDLQLEDLYTLVSSDKWTFDKFAEMGKAALKDVNGNGKTEDGDRFGFNCLDKHVLPSFWVSAGAKSVKKDKDDLPYFSVPGDAKFAEVYEKIFKITKDNGIHTNVADVFKNDLSLFNFSNFGSVGKLRDMTSDFGIIPFPKYDEKQESYYSRIGGGSLNIIPVTVKDKDFASIVLEGLASESRKSLIPIYYDVALKSKYTRDEKSVEMLDIIFDNRIYDLGDTFWCMQLRDGVFAPMYTNNDRDLTSKMASIKDSIDKVINDAKTAFLALK